MGQVTLENLIEQYFLPINERTKREPIFCRFAGYNEDFLEFLSRYTYESKKMGVCLRHTIKNPTGEEVEFFEKTVGDDFRFDVPSRRMAIERWFPKCSGTQRRLLFETVEEYLQHLFHEQINENVLQNTFVKLLCWVKSDFNELLFLLPFVETPKILYEGALGKYQLVLLKVFQQLGCDVVTVAFAENPSHDLQIPDYCKTERIRLEQTGIPPYDFESTDWKEKENYVHFHQEMERQGCAVCTNSWLSQGGEEPLEVLLKATELRTSSSKGIPNLYVEYRGVQDKDDYESMLYRIYTKLGGEKKPFLLIEGKIPNPSMEEIQCYHSISRENVRQCMQQLVESFQFYSLNQLNVIGQNALYHCLSKEQRANPSQLSNLGITMLCWLKRYRDLYQFKGEGQLPVLIFYGSCKRKLELTFIELISNLPVDVILFSPDLQEKSQLNSERLLRFTFDQSLPLTEFPKKEARTVAGTVAYKAERELDQILYTDTGLYRARQFRNAIPVNLKTTYEEIDILWKEPAKFRPYFEAGEERVMVPNIVAKISGVRDGERAPYIESIRKKLTKDTILIKGVPHLRGTDPNPIKSHIVKLVKDRRLLIDQIKKQKEYPYSYLPENVQDFILSKIQMLIDADIICFEGGGLEYAIAAVLLNLDQKTVRMIQNFDFTEQIPKLLVIDTDETMCSLEDCIYMMFLSLVGFDVLIYSPPGYRVIEKYLKDQAVKEHIIGQYVFDMELSDIYSEKENKSSFIGRLFGKGRS